MKIVYQGSPGAYSHLAAKKIYPDYEFIPYNTFEDCLKLFTIFDLGRSKPISNIFFLNLFLSSALDIAFELAPISSILYFLSIPFFSASIAKFKAV